VDKLDKFSTSLWESEFSHFSPQGAMDNLSKFSTDKGGQFLHSDKFREAKHRKEGGKYPFSHEFRTFAHFFHAKSPSSQQSGGKVDFEKSLSAKENSVFNSFHAL
jgi:hypothetical protein